MPKMDIDTHPNPQPNPHHRKIDLQSTQDLTYLQTNLADSALQKLNLHFPKISKPATHISLGDNKAQTQETNGNRNGDNNQNEDRREEEEEEDPMRRCVHDLVSDFLNTTWRSALQNVSVNGIDASTLPIPHTATLSSAPLPSNPNSTSHSTSDPNTNGNTITNSKDSTTAPEIEGIHYTYSAFDASLQHKLASLHAELDSLTAQVSKLRRTAPGQGAAQYQTRLAAAIEADDAQFEQEMEEARGRDVEGLEIETVRGDWNQDVREMYEIGVGGLAALAGAGGSGGGSTLTETVGKAQRARQVAMEMD